VRETVEKVKNGQNSPFFVFVFDHHKDRPHWTLYQPAAFKKSDPHDTG
jgi:hypothetical protein